MLSESRECIMASKQLSTFDMNNGNDSRYGFGGDEPHQIKLSMENEENQHKQSNYRRDPQPISENTLNLFACIIAAAIATFALVGLAIALIVLAFK
ncbi:unnamed protein product [Caenorhabditis angaria]|uniref:Uncharacterized protein n=1 Tax=Caenorhabditis angaria TaxID=860376 RepID=A0A9P1IZR8_9PELO|nr:unnamed protein product [Caenorhabditis angaria]